MTLVFPSGLAAQSTKVALSKGAFWFAGVFLAVAVFFIVAISIDRGTTLALPALFALAIIAAAGVLARIPAGRYPFTIALAAGLALGGNVLYLGLVFPLLEVDAPADGLVLTLVKISIIMFGAVASRYTRATAATLVAFLIAEVPAFIIGNTTGHGYALDVASTGTFAIVFAVFALLDYSRSRSRASERVLVRASVEDREAIEQDASASSSAALVHDTILNELAVVAVSATGPISDVVRGRIQHSLSLVTGPADVGDSESGSLFTEFAGSVLSDTLDEAARSGLTLSISGDFDALSTIAPEAAAALSLAVRQCLANVSIHSGVDRAELTVLTTATDVCVLVIDSGVGFDEAQVAPDRLGLRHSVQSRIAQVGGTVRIWTSPGAGTSISVRVPRS